MSRSPQSAAISPAANPYARQLSSRTKKTRPEPERRPPVRRKKTHPEPERRRPRARKKAVELPSQIAFRLSARSSRQEVAPARGSLLSFCRACGTGWPGEAIRAELIRIVSNHPSENHGGFSVRDLRSAGDRLGELAGREAPDEELLFRDLMKDSFFRSVNSAAQHPSSAGGRRKKMKRQDEKTIGTLQLPENTILCFSDRWCSRSNMRTE